MDRYTKAVLTVIALSLAVIALRQTPPASAVSDCGYMDRPCYVTTLNPLEVRLK